MTKPRFAEEFYQLNRRNGASRERINAAIRSNSTLLAVMLLRAGIGDGMLCGTQGAYPEHLEFIESAIGLKPGTRAFAAMNLLMLPQQTLFICDTYINADPSAEELTEIALLAVEEVRRFGLNPRVALASHSSFGSRNTASATKMRETFARITARDPDLEIDGEMHGDAPFRNASSTEFFPARG
jgi:malate dehydrogenase (oxaloacetate-decarboxylating)(NADP+)